MEKNHDNYINLTQDYINNAQLVINSYYDPGGYPVDKYNQLLDSELYQEWRQKCISLLVKIGDHNHLDQFKKVTEIENINGVKMGTGLLKALKDNLQNNLISQEMPKNKMTENNTIVISGLKNSNLNIHSPNSNQNINIEKYKNDPEVNRLLLELKQAVENSDINQANAILQTINEYAKPVFLGIISNGLYYWLTQIGQ